MLWCISFSICMSIAELLYEFIEKPASKVLKMCQILHYFKLQRLQIMTRYSNIQKRWRITDTLSSKRRITNVCWNTGGLVCPERSNDWVDGSCKNYRGGGRDEKLTLSFYVFTYFISILQSPFIYRAGLILSSLIHCFKNYQFHTYIPFRRTLIVDLERICLMRKGEKCWFFLFYFYVE